MTDTHDQPTCEYSGLRSLASILQEQEEREAQRAIRPSDPLTEEECDRVIQMAWEDRTPFEAITAQFRLKEKDVIALMRSQLQPSSFRLWRRRMKARRTKHAARRANTVLRFRSRLQRDTGTRIAKR
jgi:uncharacterized protein (TIGR03643 family)